jgi:hypothetical protein
MQYCVINGSPRGRSGNTNILLRQVVDGIERASLPEITWIYLNDAKKRKTAHEAFREADVVVLGFPLYTDGMPGLVKAFIESLVPYTGSEGNPRMAFLVQSGFQEAHHSRYVERYLEKLTFRLNAPYAGTIVKGGCEGLRLQPEESHCALFAQLKAVGANLALEGVFDQESLRLLSKPEKYPRILAPLFWLALRLPITQSYWDNQLKKNGAYEERFARPFKENSSN